MNASLKCSLTLSAVVMVGAAASAFALSGGGFEIPWHSIDGGGGNSSGGGYALAGTLGQSDAGAMSGGGYSLVGGFWAIESQPEPPCAGDVDGDGAVDVDDMVQVIVSWGVCPPPCPADGNGDGIVNVQDLVAVIVAWGACP